MKSRGVAVVSAVLTAVGLVTAVGSAQAQPQPSVSSVQAKLNKLTNKENVLIQRYDVVNEQLKSAQQQLKLVNQHLRTDQAEVQKSRGRVAQIASAAYEDGQLTSQAALLTTASPQVILSQSAILVHLSTARQQQLKAYLVKYSEMLSARQMAKRAESAIAALHRQLAGQKRYLDKLIAQQKALYNSLTAQQQQQVIGGGGTTGGGYHGPTKTQAEKAVAYVYSQLGCPYSYGATGPCNVGFDCSGLMYAAWGYAGVQIPRDSFGQAGLPSVPMSQIQPGDILEFAGDTHVGMYVGGGYLIDAPTTGIPVEKVSLKSSWYAQNLDGAVRP